MTRIYYFPDFTEELPTIEETPQIGSVIRLDNNYYQVNDVIYDTVEQEIRIAMVQKSPA